MSLFNKVVMWNRWAIMVMTFGVMTSTCLNADDPEANELLPKGSLGYIHIEVKEIQDIPQLDVVKQLLSKVNAEASLLSSNRLGLDVTSLTDVTVVLPTFEQFMASTQDPPICVVANFDKTFRVSNLAKKLKQQSWEVKNFQNQTIFENDESALLVESNSRLVLGTKDSVRWWVSTETEEGNWTLTQMMDNSFDAGEILFGVDLRAIPKSMFAMLPQQAQMLSKTDFVSLIVDIDDEINLNAVLNFPETDSVGPAKNELDGLIRQGTEFLAETEAEMQEMVNSRDSKIDDAIGGLVGLAFIRQVAEGIENIEISQESQYVSVSVSVDYNLLYATLGTAGLAQLGAEEARFEDIADQLNAPTE